MVGIHIASFSRVLSLSSDLTGIDCLHGRELSTIKLGEHQHSKFFNSIVFSMVSYKKVHNVLKTVRKSEIGTAANVLCYSGNWHQWEFLRVVHRSTTVHRLWVSHRPKIVLYFGSSYFHDMYAKKRFTDNLNTKIFRTVRQARGGPM